MVCAQWLVKHIRNSSKLPASTASNIPYHKGESVVFCDLGFSIESILTDKKIRYKVESIKR